MVRGPQRFKRLARTIGFSLVAILLGALVRTRPAAAQCAADATNTLCGSSALLHNTGANNSAFGSFSLSFNTQGTFNTGIGLESLQDNTTGSFNTASGAEALGFGSPAGSDNTADGFAALLHNAGHDNTASGFGALTTNTTGFFNTASGASALSMNTTGINDTADGVAALQNNTEGNNNTADGTAALGGDTTGFNNIGIGDAAGQNIVAGNNNIEIGTSGKADESNTIRIGTPGTQKATFIAGIGAAMLSSGTPVVINADRQLGVMPSSARYKRDIQDMGSSSDALMMLRPVTFRYKNDPKGQRQFGLIAEEVARVYPELVSYDQDGKPQTVQYQNLIAMLLNELQKQSTELQEQSIELHREVVANRNQAQQIAQQSIQLHRRAIANQKQAQEIAQLRTRQEQQIGALEARLEALEHVKTARDVNHVATASFDR
jgi:hypothetical protein